MKPATLAHSVALGPPELAPQCLLMKFVDEVELVSRFRLRRLPMLFLSIFVEASVGDQVESVGLAAMAQKGHLILAV